MRRADWRRVRTGFTIIELIVSVSVVALLMGISLPAISKVRMRTLQASTQSRMRQCSQVLSVYASDWRGAFPAFLDPRRDSWRLEVRSEGVSIEIEKYFLSCMVWNIAMADSYFDGNPTNQVFYSAEQSSRDGPGGPPFLLSCAMFAAPEYWRLETRTGPAQYRATYQHQVVYPSAKVVLVNPYGLLLDEDANVAEQLILPVASAAVDGSIRSATASEYISGCDSGEGSYAQSIHVFDAFVGLHTIAGVRGRDLP